jgi:hypothetical protein
VFYVADPISSIETRSLPTLTRSYPRRFTFYVADPISSIHLRSFALPSFQWSPIMHHKRLMMRAKSNGNSKSVSASSRCNGREATARLSNQVAAATARRIVVADDVFVLLART